MSDLHMDAPSKLPKATVEEHTTHKRHHDRPLKWFQSPVSHDEHIPASDANGHGKFEQIPVPLGHNTAYQSLNDSEQQSWYPTKLHPVFKRHGEATPLELFYDLFFVANLTAFTNAHPINDGRNLRSYIGFFTLLWFTWFNVSLYDLRLGRDSVFDRCCKAIQFGVMIGFVGCGVEFNPNQVDEFESGQALALLLAGSRFALCAQYIAAFFFLKHYKGALPPMIMTIATTFGAGLAYVGTSFAFPPFNDHLHKPYIIWYFICGTETALTLFAAMRWRLLSFKGTHVVERMTLLTLIILGEGIIGMAEAIHKVLESDVAGHTGSTTASVRGAIVAAILILYFLYMLYFDNIPEEHFGTIRSQIWAWFHFPLHVALVLFVEGSVQGIKWRRIQGQLDILQEKYEKNPLMDNALYPYLRAITDPKPSLDQALDQASNQVERYVTANNRTDVQKKFFTDQAQDLAGIFSDVGSNVKLKDLTAYDDCGEALGTIAISYALPGLKLVTALLTIYTQSTVALLKAFGAQLPEEGGHHKKAKISVPQLNATIQESVNATDDASDSERRSISLFKRAGGGGHGGEKSGEDADLEQFVEQLTPIASTGDLFIFSFMYYYISGGLALLALGLLAMLGKKSRWNRWDIIRFVSFAVFGLMLGLLSLTALSTATQGLMTSPMVVPTAMILVLLPVIFNHL